jgi:hypothetical protein
MLIAFLLFEAEGAVIKGDFETLSHIMQLGGSGTLVGIVVATASGVPIGYLIFQLYFVLRWNWWGSRYGVFWWLADRWPCLALLRRFGAPGRVQEILALLGLGGSINEVDKDGTHGIQPSELAVGAPWKEMFISNLTSDHRLGFAFLENYWLEVTNTEDGKAEKMWAARSRHLFDILHGLGALRVAIALSYLTFAIYELRSTCTGPLLTCFNSSSQTLDWLVVFVTLLTVTALWWVITANRTDTVTRIEVLWYYVLKTHLSPKTTESILEDYDMAGN